MIQLKDWYIKPAMPLRALSDLFKKVLEKDEHNGPYWHLGKETVAI